MVCVVDPTDYLLGLRSNCHAMNLQNQEMREEDLVFSCGNVETDSNANRKKESDHEKRYK